MSERDSEREERRARFMVEMKSNCTEMTNAATAAILVQSTDRFTAMRYDPMVR